MHKSCFIFSLSGCFMQQPGSVCITPRETEPNPEFYVKLQKKGDADNMQGAFPSGFWIKIPMISPPQTQNHTEFRVAALWWGDSAARKGKERNSHFPTFLRITVSNEDQYKYKRLILHMYIVLCCLNACDNPNGQGPHLHSNPWGFVAQILEHWSSSNSRNGEYHCKTILWRQDHIHELTDYHNCSRKQLHSSLSSNHIYFAWSGFQGWLFGVIFWLLCFYS